MDISRPKVIYDPLCGVVDIRSVLPMVDAPEFQLLRERKQLSMSDIAFPAARHSRFEHSLGAMAATRRLADRWVKDGILTKDEREALKGYALYHDIGHGALSHWSEDFIGDHKVQTIVHATRLRSIIEKCGIDFDLMMSLLKHENPLHLMVSDKNIGIEKLDYLERDGMYTGVGKPNGIQYLRKYMYFVDGQVAVDEKMIEHVQDTMRFYAQMYKDVYLRKCLVIAQRTFHKALYYLVDAGVFNPMCLANMTDGEVLGVLALQRHRGADTLYRRLRTRQLLKEAVVLRPEQYVCETRVLAKSIRVIGLDEERMNKLLASPALAKQNHLALEMLESKVAKLCELPSEDVVIVPVFYAERFWSKDVHILGGDGKVHSMRERRPKAFESMEETARSRVAIRVCVPEEVRARVSEKAKDILAVFYYT
jgi:HD superfamily phosphohydrolase